MPVPVLDIEWDSTIFTLGSPSVDDASFPDEYNHFSLAYFPSSGTLTGVAKTRRGRPIWVTSTRDTITLAHNDSGSAAGNRFSCPNGVDLVLGANETAMLVYNHANLRWDVFHGWASASSGGTSFPASPYDGQAFHRTDLRETFYYDAGEVVWYGSNTVTLDYGKASVTASGVGQYLEGPGNSAHGTTNGYPIPVGWDHARMLAVGAAWTGAINGNLFVRENGTNIRTLMSSAATRVEVIDIFEKLTANTEIEMAFQFNSGSITNITSWVQIVRAFDVSN